MRSFLNRFVLASLLFCLLSGFTACQSVTDRLFVTKSAKEKEIATLRVAYEGKLAAKDAETAEATKRVAAAKDAQAQGAITALYGQTQVFNSIVTPTRTDILFNNLAQEGWAALGGAPPSREAMQAMNDRLRKELDATQTSLADLQRNHNAALAANQALADATARYQKEVEAAEAARAAIDKDYRGKLDVAQASLNETNDQLVASEHARANDSAARAAQLAKLSWGAGIIAALCVVGAIVSPVFKAQLGMAAVAFGGAAVAIPYLTGWWVLAGVGLVLAGLTIWMLRAHHIETKFGDAMALAAQRVKDTAGDAWTKTVGPIVADSLSRYAKVGGKVLTIPDASMTALMDSKLIDYQAHSGDAVIAAPPATVANPLAAITTNA